MEKERKRQEKTKKIMTNVMAALNTFGIEYDVNVSGFDVESKLKDLFKKATPVEYDAYKGEAFKEEFDKFVNMPQYGYTTGTYWADDNDFVVIQFSRTYIMTDEDWEEYAAFYGYANADEAMACGDPSPSRIYFNAKVKKGQIDSFVRNYAKHCWQ